LPKFLAENLKFRFLRIRENINTTIVCILTNAKIDKLGCYKLSKRSIIGISRSIDPSFTSYDGDIIFALTTNNIEFPFEELCEITNFVVSESIRSIAQKMS
jgi:L-aminopeptidase/D-esterase-like protein